MKIGEGPQYDAGGNRLWNMTAMRKRPDNSSALSARKKRAGPPNKYTMCYTPYRGLTQISIRGRLKFAAINFKKLAIRKWHVSRSFCFLSLSDKLLPYYSLRESIAVNLAVFSRKIRYIVIA